VATTILDANRYLGVTLVGWCGYHRSVTLFAGSASLEMLSFGHRGDVCMIECSDCTEDGVDRRHDRSICLSACGDKPYHNLRCDGARVVKEHLDCVVSH
jgi:hypothetical protein